MKRNKNLLLIIGIIIIAVIFLVFYRSSQNPSQGGLYDDLAQCISDSGAKFYGAYWCPTCNDQKDLFADSASLLPYVECSLPNSRTQNLACKKENIEAYPTWRFEDGTENVGKLSFEELATKTGCSVPAGI
jgi:thiol-disulfide isomerase/thioredoxin